MKPYKLIGLLAIATISLIALPADAGATGSVFCAAQESPCKESNLWSVGIELDFSLKSGTSAVLANTAGETLDTCTESTAKGRIEVAEGVTGPIESLTWGGCSSTTTTLTKGKLEVQSIAGTHNGTVVADGTIEVTVNTIFGSCIYGVTSGNSLGELKEGLPATFVANAVAEKFAGSNFSCPSTAKWTAEYRLKEPGGTTLSVESGTKVEASVFCAAQESPCKESNLWATGTTPDFTLKTGTKATLANTAGEALDECTNSTLKGKLERVEPVTGSIESLTWGSCTFTTTTTELGKLEVENAATSHNGTVKADGETKITINGGFFGSCLYGLTSKTDLGELKEGKPATLPVNAVLNKLSGSAAACPETAKWTAELTLSEPSEKTLAVERTTVSDAVFCSVAKSPCPEANRWGTGTELDFSIPTGGSSVLVNTANEGLDTCTESTAKGKIEIAEGVIGPIESLTWSGCTFTTTTLKAGKLKVARIAGTSNGTVTAASVSQVTINTIFFGSCIYGVTNNTSIGDITEGNPAVFHANAVAQKMAGSAFACPLTAKWTATYNVTEPKEKTLSVETG